MTDNLQGIQKGMCLLTQSVKNSNETNMELTTKFQVLKNKHISFEIRSLDIELNVEEIKCHWREVY